MSQFMDFQRKKKMTYRWQETLVSPEVTISETLRIIARSSLQIALVVDDQGKLLGTVTDGDIRRALISSTALDVPVRNIMNADPLTGSPNDGYEVLIVRMQPDRLHQIPIVNDDRVVVGLVTQADGPIGAGPELASLASGRAVSFFSEDMRGSKNQLDAQIDGRRILVIGGAGSIGGAVVHKLAAGTPAALHIVDQNENNLAEIVRDLRSRANGLEIKDFRTYPLDYGSQPMRMILTDMPPYDVILNFAALKHVRSEKDIYSLLQMLDTNVAKQVRFMRWLKDTSFTGRYFCVSTDKAANPVSLLGASKRLMEHIIFSDKIVSGFKGQVTSARFANVAFSEGSLLHAFLNRLRKRQPLAVPKDTRRYFVSLDEAADICLLAAMLAQPNTIVVPRLNPEHDLQLLDGIAVKVLEYFGMEAVIYEEEEAARKAINSDLRHSQYPLLLTALNTSGEKPFEEFVGENERITDIGFKSIEGVSYIEPEAGTLEALFEEIENILAGKTYMDKDTTVGKIAKVIPEFHHIETGKNLDQRM
jgi:FlaA1/EpsC-like NDP-sugar epimerase